MMLDSCGRIVPRRLESIFVEGQRLKEIIGKLRWLQSEVTGRRDEPSMRDVDVVRVAKHLGAAASLLGLGVPTSSRCSCHPRELDCPACHGQKWTSELSLLKRTNGEPLQT